MNDSASLSDASGNAFTADDSAALAFDEGIKASRNAEQTAINNVNILFYDYILL